MNKAMLVMSGLLFSPLAVAGQITMTDPQQETTESGKTLCTDESPNDFGKNH